MRSLLLDTAEPRLEAIMIVSEETIDRVESYLKGSGKISTEQRNEAIDLLKQRSKEWDDDLRMSADPDFIVYHALEDAGVPREERLAVTTDLFE